MSSFRTNVGAAAPMLSADGETDNFVRNTEGMGRSARQEMLEVVCTEARDHAIEEATKVGAEWDDSLIGRPEATLFGG